MARPWEVTGDEIHLWSQRYDAAFKLPELVRRLLLATLPAGEVEMRADGGVRDGGWDGVVQASRPSPFCPQGVSVWELTTQARLRDKLDKDFDKRAAAPPAGIRPSVATYVAVTGHRFKAKQDWLAERRQRGAFGGVRLLDADDLAAWLTQAPAVMRWFASMLDKPSYDLADLDDFASRFENRTRPPLPLDVLLAGRERERAAESLREWAREPSPSPCFVRADTRDEALAFAVAALLRAPEPLRELFQARALIVESSEALRWAQRAGTGEPLILLPNFDGFEPRMLSPRDHALVPLDGRTTAGRNGIQLEPVPYQRFAEILAQAGFPEAEARSRAQASGGMIVKLQRLFGYVAPPLWAGHVDRTHLSTLLLLGAWQPANEADREVARALGTDPRDLEALSEQLSLVADAATVKDIERWGQATWRLSATGDAWQALAGGIPAEVLRRFETVVVEVLGKVDPRYELPKEQRFAAAFQGQIPRESTAVREGLARTLARLGQSDEVLGHLHGPQRGSRLAAAVVQRVLAPAWIGWASLSALLPLFAEAAPTTFLACLERSLEDGGEGAGQLLAEEDSYFGSPHTGLLWALETLGWSTQLMPRVALALAKLARQDKDADQPGRLSNRPARSLQQLLRPAFAETLAPVELRLSILRGLLSITPDVAYPLLLRFLGRGIAMWYAHRWPEFLPWRLYDEEHRDAAEKEADSALLAIMNLAIDHAADNAGHWAALLTDACHPGGDDEISLRLLNRLDECKEHIRDEEAAIWTGWRSSADAN